ncbi:MAG TPA: LamG-like jellyroll fold domain-containing protein, partial [Actinospica sp.]|nr:LamG-like jellyroll fold domain-containing protein [Actinospica sp.]
MHDDEVTRPGLTRRRVLRGTALGALGAALPAAGALGGLAGPAWADGGGTDPLALTIDATSPGHAVSPRLFGAFFEEINYAGVGGLYAELLRNRAFMDPATPVRWYAPADIPRVPGKFGSAVQLGGGSPVQYVQLPAGIVAGLTDFTAAAWVNPSSIATWNRVFDFGDGENVYMFMTVSAGAAPRFAITVESNG